MTSPRYQIKRSAGSNLKTRLIWLGVLFLAASAFVFPTYINRGIEWVNAKSNVGLPFLPAAGFNLGLDLQGGAHLVYQAKVDQVPEADRKDAVEGVRDVIERRVRGGLGVAEPLVQTTRVGNDYRIIVELPGVTDVNQAIKMIGETPVLEFKEENNEPPRELTAAELKDLNTFNQAADKKAREALLAVRGGMDFGQAAAKYSEDDKTKNNGGDLGFITQDLFPEIYIWAKEHKDGEISREVVKSFNGVNIVKRIAERPGEKRVTASHLLNCYKGAERCDNPTYTKEQAFAKIQELQKEATAKNFTDLVKKYSTEPGAGERGGSLGTFKK